MGIRIGIFGGGSIARKAYLPLLVSWPEVEIGGIYSRTEKTIGEMCDRWHIGYGTTDVSALIAREIQAALVLTNTPSHFDICRQLLAAGIDVYVEKPATQTSRETYLLADLARQKGRIFMVGFNRRYAPLYRQARDLFKDHEIELCVIEKHRPSVYHTSLFNSYLDDTIHQIDLLCFFCPDPQPLHTSYKIKDGKLVAASSVARLSGGGMGLVLTSLQAGAWQEHAGLRGGGLSVEVSAFRQLRLIVGDREEVYGNDRPGKWLPDLVERGFSNAIEHFFACVQTRAEPETNGDEAAKTQEFMEKLAAIAS